MEKQNNYVYSCPKCNNIVEPTQNYCTNCRVDLNETGYNDINKIHEQIIWNSKMQKVMLKPILNFQNKKLYLLEFYDKNYLIKSYEVENISADELSLGLLFNLFSKERKFRALIGGIVMFIAIVLIILIS